jgi:MoxR-like ATPase
MREKVDQLVENLNRTIVGKADAIRLVLVALFSGGHALLEDVPGVGKTLLAKSLARSIDGKFQRLQCTPDLLPADTTGTNIWNPRTGDFEFLAGPVFSNILLVDEINRATPRTQSALLEVMEERQVTVDGVSRPVPTPFFAIATQNPIEYQGTFPLPEAQMDRFTLSFSLGYPSETEELQMLQRLDSGVAIAQLQSCISTQQVQKLQDLCKQVEVSSELQEYMRDLVVATRNHEDIALGVSPRGTVALYRATQAFAYIQGNYYNTQTGTYYAIEDHVKWLAPFVLAHRMIPAGGKDARSIIQQLLQSVPTPSAAQVKK